jgi:aminopeptidase-like protein
MTIAVDAGCAARVDAGLEMHRLAARLFPICRSLTGEGVRQSLRILRDYVPLQISEVPSGTSVFDWVVPKEWNIADAYVANARGQRVIDFRQHTLHVVQYSVPVRTRMTREALLPHLHSRPDRPNAIPYRTSYYRETWGFCLADRDLQRLESGEYDVVIDSSLRDGSLTYGDLYLPGEEPGEVLFHAHVCHPSMANDNLSGMVVAAFLARRVASRRRRLSYRFVFLPGTIGPIAWLARHEDVAQRIRHGLVLTGVGDRGAFTYKRSRRGNAPIDRAMQHLLQYSSDGAKVCDFEPYGYDERQYCSPGFDLPVGCLMRSVHGSYPEYHTSEDDLDFISPASLSETLDLCERLVDLLERDRVCVNLSPRGEPQLGRRGLYRPTGGTAIDAEHMALLWVLNQSDGTRSIFDIAERARLPFHLVESAATRLEAAGLLKSHVANGVLR